MKVIMKASMLTLRCKNLSSNFYKKLKFSFANSSCMCLSHCGVLCDTCVCRI